LHFHELQWGSTPLEEASRRGHAAVVVKLLAAGADKEAKNVVRGAGCRGVVDR